MGIFQKLVNNSILGDTRRVFKILPKRLKIQFYIVFILQVIFGLLEFASIAVLAFFAAVLANPDMVKNSIIFSEHPGLAAKLSWLFMSEQNLIFFASLLVLFFIALKNLLSFINFYYSAKFSENTAYHIGSESFRCYLYQPFLWHISSDSKKLQNGIASRFSLSTYIVSQLQAYSYIIVIVFLIIGLMATSVFTTSFVMVIITIASLIIYSSIKKKVSREAKIIADGNGKESEAYSTASNSIREVIVYQQEEVFLDVFKKNGRRLIAPKSFASIAHIIPTWILETVGFGIISASIGINFYYFGLDKGSVIAILSILTLTAWRLLPVVYRLVGVMVVIRGQRIIAGSCIDLMEQLGKTLNPQARLPVDPDFQVQKEIRLTDVTFHYPHSANAALHDISVTIERGTSVGLIGSSGAGKSTLAGVLSGLLTPTSGTVTVDGKALSGQTYSSYLHAVGFVPQQTNLIAGTIADNVAFSQWGSAYDVDKVLKACRQAAMDFVVNVPNGHLIPVTQNDSGLSGGQMQRISIARALYAEPQVIIFDEATSSLDLGNENIIRQTINKLKGQLTSIIIAHRLSTVEKCDRIIWLEQGRVRMDGTPEVVLQEYMNFQNSLHDPN